MQNLPKPIRLFAPLAALLAAVLVIAGCGTSSPDIARGRVLFTSKCGVCHTLAPGGTTATLRPHLATATPPAAMPAHIAEATDADDIAAYVGKYAGVPGAAPPEVEGGAGA